MKGLHLRRLGAIALGLSLGAWSTPLFAQETEIPSADPADETPGNSGEQDTDAGEAGAGEADAGGADAGEADAGGDEDTAVVESELLPEEAETPDAGAEDLAIDAVIATKAGSEKGETAPQAPAEEETPPEKPTDEVDVSVSLGFSANTGNTQSLFVNGGTRGRWKRRKNELSGEGTFTYGRAKIDTTGDGSLEGERFRTNAANLLAKARYDRYMTEKDAAFLGAVVRRDIFAGLDARAQGQVGYARQLYKIEKHRVWVEGGYDFTYDDLYPNPLLDPDGNAVDNEALVHAVRLFAGYENQLYEAVSVVTGIEALLNLQEGKDVRLNGRLELNSKITERFKAGVIFTVAFDNVPVPGNQKTDTMTQLALTYDVI